MANTEILTSEVRKLKAEVKRLKAQSWRAEVAGGQIRRTRAQLYDTTEAPLADRWSDGMFAFCTDGRKTGEGAGAGTGAPVYFNEDTTTWLRYSDDTEVQT